MSHRTRAVSAVRTKFPAFPSKTKKLCSRGPLRVSIGFQRAALAAIATRRLVLSCGGTARQARNITCKIPKVQSKMPIGCAQFMNMKRIRQHSSDSSAADAQTIARSCHNARRRSHPSSNAAARPAAKWSTRRETQTGCISRRHQSPSPADPCRPGAGGSASPPNS